MHEVQPVEMLKRILETYEQEIVPLLDEKEYSTVAMYLEKYLIAYQGMMRGMRTEHPYILILGDQLGTLKEACERCNESVIDMARDGLERSLGNIDLYLQK